MSSFLSYLISFIMSLHPRLLSISSQVLYAMKEYACTAIDVIARRTRLGFLNVQAADEALPRIVEIMGKELDWSEQRRTVGETPRTAFEFMWIYIFVHCFPTWNYSWVLFLDEIPLTAFFRSHYFRPQYTSVERSTPSRARFNRKVFPPQGFCVCMSMHVCETVPSFCVCFFCIQL